MRKEGGERDEGRGELPQLSSSLLSPQSSCPSQCWCGGRHEPEKHRNMLRAQSGGEEAMKKYK